MRDWNIREADAADAEALALVGAATFLEAFADVIEGKDIVAHCAKAHSAQVYRDYLATGSIAWLAETALGAPIGYALNSAPDLPGMAVGDRELKRIYVLSRWHGSGLAAALMAQSLQEASDHDRLLLGVYRHNHRARAFYAKHGFVTIAERMFRVGETDHHDLVLARLLTATESTP
ncbi:GNAT family N-acetyltransferase [Novosphingobium sp.]|uniref:GNAT family N-acetyltransferase n=1 Tax=Novosphingobium sp. TaxID=1874826 RepID=UPI00286D46A9|nr:GNAT family N-acetyltransferase [Novosphingobium sp.]